MAKKYENRRILVLSDTHFPYSHPDTIPYLKAIKKKYSPDRVVHIGDEADFHAFHLLFNPDPDLYSPGHEADKAVEDLKLLKRIWDKIDFVDSNHKGRVKKKSKASMLPKRFMKAYRDAIEAPKGWKWHKQLFLTMSNGEKVCFRHEFKGVPIAAAQKMGCSVVQGHKHTRCEIIFNRTPTKILFAVTVGCSIDTESAAFEYDEENLSRPIISHTLIEEGNPRNLVMPVDKRGRWNGKVP